MKFQSLMLLILTLSLFTAAGCEQEPQTPAGTQTTSGAGTTASLPDVPKFDTLHDLMEELADHFKFLRRHTESGQADELLEYSATIRALVAQAKTMTPEQVEDAQDAEKQKLSDAFQKHLGETTPALDAFDAAIKADDRAAAAKAVEQLHEAEEHGHEALGVKDDH